MTKLCFFNFYHNGDLFHSKPFVRQIISHLGKENVVYAHNKSSSVIQDLDITTVRLEGMSDKTKIVRTQDPDMLFVNTWIGSYFDKYEGECTLKFNMRMWSDIFEEINKIFNSIITLGSVEDYLPYVDYDKFDVSHVKFFVESEDRSKILFCNGPALSGQSEYNTDMEDIIRSLAVDNPNKLFIVTHKITNDLSNVVYSGDITKVEGSDLNQISYLSKYCDLIIGRNSGPFCFASTGDNLNDSTKTFYAFGCRETDCFLFGIEKKANYIFENTKEPDKIQNTIKRLLKNI